jgi:hypothetical protein
MLPKSVITCLAATAFATGVLMPTDASAGRGGGPQWGTWNWPPYAESGEGGMPRTTCGYVWVNSHHHKPRKGQWNYHCQ